MGYICRFVCLFASRFVSCNYLQLFALGHLVYILYAFSLPYFQWALALTTLDLVPKWPIMFHKHLALFYVFSPNHNLKTSESKIMFLTFVAITVFFPAFTKERKSVLLICMLVLTVIHLFWLTDLYSLWSYLQTRTTTCIKTLTHTCTHMPNISVIIILTQYIGGRLYQLITLYELVTEIKWTKRKLFLIQWKV